MTSDVPEIIVRELRGSDRAAWDPLWAGYLDFYGEDLEQEVTDVVFQRLVDPGWSEQWGLVAEVDGRIVGLAHLDLQSSTWSIAPHCYLEDLFVAPSARGDGVGRALFEHLVAEGRDAGWRQLHWLTDADNETARRLYDRVGTLGEEVRYTIEL